MKIVLDVRKSLQENAATFFENAKKAKKKLEGALKALNLLKQKIERLEREIDLLKQESKSQIQDMQHVFTMQKRKTFWFEKFRWCLLPGNVLILAGRDATTNEILIKKYAKPSDTVLHCELRGSAFIVLKQFATMQSLINGELQTLEQLDENVLQLAADFAVTMSKAWKFQLYSYNVAIVKGSQVSKKARHGEYLTKGAFMITGKIKTITGKLNLALGLVVINDQKKVMAGPLQAVKTFAKQTFQLIPGNRKASDIAKQIAKHFSTSVDEVIKALPSGGFEIRH
ncbi:DUF814 domain-containing protein [Candidatus Woesearchaeota archaeon]|nr:DUF814 domain-containing protein [Candidatus Woesearchaeota archaeon]